MIFEPFLTAMILGLMAFIAAAEPTDDGLMGGARHD